MKIIDREDFEEMVKELSSQTDIPETEIRKRAEMIAEVNGYQIEDIETVQLVEHFSSTKH